MSVIRGNYKTLTLTEKMSLLPVINKKSDPKEKLALKYGIPNSSLSSVLKNSLKIEESFYKLKGSITRQCSWPSKYKELEGILHIHLSWMTDQQMAIVVLDKTCRYKQSLSRCHFMSKLFLIYAF